MIFIIFKSKNRLYFQTFYTKSKKNLAWLPDIHQFYDKQNNWSFNFYRLYVKKPIWFSIIYCEFNEKLSFLTWYSSILWKKKKFDWSYFIWVLSFFGKKPISFSSICCKFNKNRAFYLICINLITKSNKNRVYFTWFSITWCNLNKKMKLLNNIFINFPEKSTKLHSTAFLPDVHEILWRKTTFEAVSIWCEFKEKKAFSQIFINLMQKVNNNRKNLTWYLSFLNQKTVFIYKHFKKSTKSWAFLPDIHQFYDEK